MNNMENANKFTSTVHYCLDDRLLYICPDQEYVVSHEQFCQLLKTFGSSKNYSTNNQFLIAPENLVLSGAYRGYTWLNLIIKSYNFE